MLISVNGTGAGIMGTSHTRDTGPQQTAVPTHVLPLMKSARGLCCMNQSAGNGGAVEP